MIQPILDTLGEPSVFLTRSFDELNLTSQDLMTEVHQGHVPGGGRAAVRTGRAGDRPAPPAAAGLVVGEAVKGRLAATSSC